MRIRPAYSAAFALFAALPSFAQVITVTNADDSGAGSFRQAVTDADSGTLIDFAIADAGVQTISLLTPLPPIAAGVTIDGTTQGAAACDSWPPTLLVELDGGSLVSGDVLAVGGANVAIRGLVVNSGPANGISVGAFANFSLSCSFVGTDPSGALDYGNAGNGVALEQSTGAQIGGAAETDRNLIAANAAAGIDLSPLASGNTIAGNYIGTTAAGTVALSNGVGIGVQGTNNEIGGVVAEAGNVIAGNVTSGIELDANSANGNQILRNAIGVDAAGFTLSNGGAGVLVASGASNNVIGTPADGNEIRANGGGGVVVSGNGSLGNAIRGNSLAGNGSIGIDLLGTFFEDANDADDPDGGPNRLQNTPVLAAGSYTSETQRLNLTFSVDTDPANATYPLAIDFYRADGDDEEGEIYLGSASYSAADFATGSVERSFIAEGAVAVGDRVVATATDAAGNTSEYSDVPAVLAVPEPAAPAAALAAIGALTRLRRRRR